MGRHSKQPRDAEWLYTWEVAELIGMSTRYVRGEITDGLLEAERITRPVRGDCTTSQDAIRIYPHQLIAYLQKYWPSVKWPRAA